MNSKNLNYFLSYNKLFEVLVENRRPTREEENYSDRSQRKAPHRFSITELCLGGQKSIFLRSKTGTLQYPITEDLARHEVEENEVGKFLC